MISKKKNSKRGLTLDVWSIFNHCFKKGDEVMLVDCDDRVFCGKLTSFDDDGCRIRSITGVAVRFEWWDIVFMSHDGFPCRKLKGAEGSALIDSVDTTNIQEAVRRAAISERCQYPNCKVITDAPVVSYWHGHSRLSCNKCAAEKFAETMKEATKDTTIVRGDPFLIENVSMHLFNVGNSGPQFWDTYFEEVAVLVSKDGAKAMLTELPTVYFYETCGK